MMCWERICWRPTLGNNRDALEVHNPAKQHMVHCIWGIHKGDLERGMLKRWTMLEITHSNCYHVRTLVDEVNFHFIQITRDNIAECTDVHSFESEAQHLEMIDSLLSDNKNCFRSAERIEDGACSSNTAQIESNAANKCQASSWIASGSNYWAPLREIFSLDACPRSVCRGTLALHGGQQGW